MPDARLFLLPLLVLLVPARAAEITVNTTRSGAIFKVEASAEFKGSLSRAWQVLTDYERLSAFIPDLEMSRVVSRERTGALVEQKGAARLLFFRYPVDVRLAVTEYPYERVVSHSVAGNFRELRSTYTLAMSKGHILLQYSGRMVPDFYVPPLIGTWAFQHSVESTFRALVDEMERVPKAGEK